MTITLTLGWWIIPAILTVAWIIMPEEPSDFPGLGKMLLLPFVMAPWIVYLGLRVLGWIGT